LPGHDIIAIGASAGGVEALVALVRDLPPDLPAAVFVALHIPAQSPSMLPMILDRSGPLPASQPQDGEVIEPGRIYVAPPDHHLLVNRGQIRVMHGPKENRHRPAIDPLFRSAARAYGPRVVGVVLTGALDDGTAGLRAIKKRGGVAIVQDPAEALFPGMPQSALDRGAADHCVPLRDIPPLLAQIADQPAADEAAYPVPTDMDLEARIVERDMDILHNEEHPGTPSAFSCPECGGVLWELRDGELIRYRCRVGHAFSPDSVLAEQAETLEEALWSALKTLEENISLSRRLADNARARGYHQVAARFEEKRRDAGRRAALIQQVLIKDEPIAVTTGEGDNHKEEENKG
jgi:two-component system chemotaxis response regulator CheB